MCLRRLAPKDEGESRVEAAAPEAYFADNRESIRSGGVGMSIQSFERPVRAHWGIQPA